MYKPPGSDYNLIRVVVEVREPVCGIPVNAKIETEGIITSLTST